MRSIVIVVTLTTLAFSCAFLPQRHVYKVGKTSRRSHQIFSDSQDEEHQLTPLARQFVQKGKPSSPGWKNRKKKRKRLDDLTEWAVSDEANRPIICEYDPDAWWLWKKWRGTALSMVWGPVMINIALGICVDRYVHFYSDETWPLFAVPPAESPVIQQLVGMKSLWEYQLTLCTFILAFFTSQAYTHWKSVYFTTRAIQGRINDVCMLITISAKRPDKTDAIISAYTDEAKELVETCTRLIRLSHTF